MYSAFVPNISVSFLHWQILKKVKLKSSPTGHVSPEGSRRVKAPSFRDNGTVMVIGCQPYAPAAFTPRSIPDDNWQILVTKNWLRVTEPRIYVCLLLAVCRIVNGQIVGNFN